MQNDELIRTTKQLHISTTVQSLHFSLFGQIAYMPYEADANNSFSPTGQLEETTGPFLYNVVGDYSAGPESTNNMSMSEAINMVHYCPLWRFMPVFGTMHS